jgi:hypothetical protein
MPAVRRGGATGDGVVVAVHNLTGCMRSVSVRIDGNRRLSHQTRVGSHTRHQSKIHSSKPSLNEISWRVGDVEVDFNDVVVSRVVSTRPASVQVARSHLYLLNTCVCAGPQVADGGYARDGYRRRSPCGRSRARGSDAEAVGQSHEGGTEGVAQGLDCRHGTCTQEPQCCGIAGAPGRPLDPGVTFVVAMDLQAAGMFSKVIEYPFDTVKGDPRLSLVLFSFCRCHLLITPAILFRQ